MHDSMLGNMLYRNPLCNTPALFIAEAPSPGGYYHAERRIFFIPLHFPRGEGAGSGGGGYVVRRRMSSGVWFNRGDSGVLTNVMGLLVGLEPEGLLCTC